MAESKFDFYENVKVVTKDPSLEKINGRKSVILGKTLTEDGEWYYAIGISGENGWCAMEYDLISLGTFSNKEEFYSGESVKVHVNEDGEGFLK